MKKYKEKTVFYENASCRMRKKTPKRSVKNAKSAQRAFFRIFFVFIISHISQIMAKKPQIGDKNIKG